MVLADGCARLPAVVALVRELTHGMEPNQTVNPEHIVAIGASLQAAILMGEVFDVAIEEVEAGNPPDWFAWPLRAHRVDRS